ncbi:MAG: DNA polymerase III subunit alpha [Candidatus Rokubacteria bacterium]|nr:DNA polymerase III subunit alpha [Candidatus Rokubacteria bacterium]
MEPRTDFVHLHVHSEYSLLDGAAHLRRLVDRAAQLRFPAIALTDHGNLFGAMDFYQLARDAGVKPIVGAELYVAPGSRFDRAPLDGQYEGANHVTVLVRNLTGYRNLIKLVSKGYLEGFYYKPRVDKELLAQHADGLLVLSGCLNSELSRLLLAGDERKARETAGWYAEVFGKEHYFVEVQAHGLPDQIRVTEGTLRIAQAVGVGVAGTNDSHYLESADARAHEVLLCLQTGAKLSDPNRWRFSTEEFYLKAAEEMRKVFAEVPEAYANTVAVAERCDLKLAVGEFHLPRYEVPAGRTLDSYLRELAEAGLRTRYPSATPDVLARLEHELEIIRGMNFSGYFLVVWDFIHFAKQRGIAVGPGRGSAAGSLVAYCLGITNIDPLRYGLLFERFLNPGRKSMPDMDIDFADDRRDEVIRYVEQKYGRDRVAQIITFNVLKAKAVIRDVGRVLGMPFGEVDKIAKLVPDTLKITLDDALRQSPPLAEMVKSRSEVAELWQVAKRLEGLSRHAGKHAAGVVISDEPLIEHVPLYKDPKGEEIITQYAMGPIEKLGLLKMDFLGLRTLTVIANTVQLVEESRGVRLDPERLPLDDPRTYQLLAEARTFGVFQLESVGMREALRQLRPERLEDVIAMVALYRPGPMQMIPEFVARRHGRVKPSYDHPLMEKYLRETYGIMVYQEQVMQIASELAGFTMGDADELRRAMGKKKPEVMAEQRAKFLSGATARGVKPRVAAKIFDLMEKFAGYGFNKCLAGDAEIEMADGSLKPIIHVRAGDRVLTKDGPFRASGVRPSGVRRIGRLLLANGMTVRCTPDHPIFSQRGWVNAEDLGPDDFVAVARELPCGSTALPTHLPGLLGYALSEGSLGYESHFYLYSTDPDEIADMARTLSRFENTTPRVEPRRNGGATSVRPVRCDRSRPSEAVRFLFGGCGLQRATALTKRVPPLVDGWNRDAIAVLVGKLFQGDGCIHPATRSIFYATSSEGLAGDVRRLLLKLGIASTIHRKSFRYRGGRRAGYTVNLLGGGPAFARFRELVGLQLVGRRRAALGALVASYRHVANVRARGTVEVIPVALSREPLREAIAKRYPSLKAGCRDLGVAYRLLFTDAAKRGIRRDTLAGLAERLASPPLHALAEAPIGWSRPRGFALEGAEPTYDFAVPGAASFIADGIVVHNSHAAAYGSVAYQTAYFKANYPVEFMAALLTSEMTNTDKIVVHVEECRAMGIEVRPPDVNVSGLRFGVAGDTIRFGLGAIKNVGEKAIESIVAAREREGPFTTLADFCRRVDLQLVNRRVLESLIKAGAFDSLGLARAQLMAGLDGALELGQRDQREREQGQGSIFDLMGGGAPVIASPPIEPPVPEWDIDQLLMQEKEVLGFYLSGHPLKRVWVEAQRLGAIGTADLQGREDGSRVVLCGLVSAMREINTKNGDRMAFATLEDMDGAVELTIFPETFRQSAAHLKSGAPLLVRGKVEGSAAARKLLAEDVRPLGEVDLEGAPPAACHIRVREGAGPEGLRALRGICEEHGGPVPVFVHLLLAGNEVVVRSRGVTVKPSPAFVAAVEGLLGGRTVRLE